jgi:hypothetical protein
VCRCLSVPTLFHLCKRKNLDIASVETQHGLHFTEHTYLSNPSRENYCHACDTHVWRTPNEKYSPELAGADKYSKQAPPSRVVPLWGGVSADGFATVLWHKQRKVSQEDWAAAVRAGRLVAALRAVNPGRHVGPWHVLCDNESFLRAPLSRKAHRAAGVVLWKIPAGSPDLNPVEKYWSWVRWSLRQKDMADLVAKRPPITKFAFKRRVQNLFRSRRSQQVAAACAGSLRKTALEVIRVKGAAAKG